MLYDREPIALILFLLFVAFVLGLSKYYARKAKSSAGYFAAGGTIHWGVNGIAFAGDYLSAASFLGICGMIAFSGYDGFLYSIGYLAGWVVALFVVAEPMKRLGRFTFTDALDAKFNSKGIQLMAAVSTLIVSLCYLIPQMVGAGVLVQPLLGLPHWAGVVMVGAIVIFIVATAGMTSTTYVQFIKGGLLIVFSTVLTVGVLVKGLEKPATPNGRPPVPATVEGTEVTLQTDAYTIAAQVDGFVKLKDQAGVFTWWQLVKQEDGSHQLVNVLARTKLETAGSFTYTDTDGAAKQANAKTLYNGEPMEARKFYQVGHLSKIVMDGKEVDKTGPVGPFAFLAAINDSEVVLFKEKKFKDGGDQITVWVPAPTSGVKIMRPGLKFKVDPIVENGQVNVSKTFWERANFVSLMMALFFGTSALPHILIRYYTVPSQRDARKSTIVAIGAIGFFYILTMYMGLGAMINGVLDMETSNMSAPLLAKLFGTFLFAIISAIAFATVLGTVSGLIVAASGAVAHDLMDNFLGIKMTDHAKVRAGKIAALGTGLVAIVLGMAFKGVNVSFLVGWAFAVAASANLPAILMLLFWKKTTAKGITASITVGIVSALGIILVSPSMIAMYNEWWGLSLTTFSKLDNPGLISMTLAFVTLVVVSLCTQTVVAETAEPVAA